MQKAYITYILIVVGWTRCIETDPSIRRTSGRLETRISWEPRQVKKKEDTFPRKKEERNE
jgi:hypothetical protein